MRELFLYSLRHVAGYTGEILFLVGDGLTDHEDMEIFNRYKAKTKHVEIIRARKPNRNYLIMTNHYGTQLTKLHLWALVEYDQIIYYDNDFTFFKDPSSCLHVCGTAPLCAVTDTSLTPKRPFLLVPIGSRTRLVNQDFSFLVIWPSHSPTHIHLLTAYHNIMTTIISQFNGGFLVVRPSQRVFDALLMNLDLADGQLLPDQVSQKTTPINHTLRN